MKLCPWHNSIPDEWDANSASIVQKYHDFYRFLAGGEVRACATKSATVCSRSHELEMTLVAAEPNSPLTKLLGARHVIHFARDSIARQLEEASNFCLHIA